MKLGRYTLAGELGRGGIGVVYRAHDPAGREVALKLVASRRGGAAERFQREARLHEQLGEAGGFVPLLDMGDSPHGPYLVMPLLGGGTLRDRLVGGRLELEEAARLVRALALALGRAHAVGIVHRDVKPDNVLFHTDGRALVADLGLAKHFRQDVSGASQSVALSRAGEMRGTVGYMAPEQLRDASKVGPPTDVFALGALLYECLTGEPAFNAPSFVELMGRIAKAQREPVRKLRPDCPAWLARVVDRAMAVHPKERYADGAAMAAALDRPVRASRRSVAALALGVGALGIALAGAALWSQRAPAPAPSPPAVALDASPAPSPSPASRFPAEYQSVLRTARARLEQVWGHGRSGDPGAVHALSRQADGRIFAAEAYALRVWDDQPDGGDPGGASPGSVVIATPTDATGRFLSAALAPGGLSGPRVMTVGETLETWSLDTGSQISVQPLGAPTRLVAVGPEGHRALVVLGRNLFHVSVGSGYREPEGKLVYTHEEPLRALASGPLGFLSGGGKRGVLHDRIGSARVALDHDEALAAVTLTPGPGSRPLTLCESGALWAWDVEGKVKRSLSVDPPLAGRATLLVAAADGAYAALASEQDVRIVDVARGTELDRIDLRATGQRVSALAFAGRSLLLGTQRGVVLRFALDLDFALPPAPRRVAPELEWGTRDGRQPGIMTGLLKHPNGLLLGCDMSGRVAAFDSASGAARAGFVAGGGMITHMAAAGPRSLMTLGGGRSLRVWELDAQGRGRERTRIGLSDHGAHAALSPDGTRAAVVSFRGKLEVWDLVKRKRLVERELSELEIKRPRRLAYLAGGDLLVGSGDGTLRRLDPQRGRVLWAFPAERNPGGVEGLRVLPGGVEALSVGGEGMIALWDLEKGRPTRQLRASGPTSDAIYLGKGRVLAAIRRGFLELLDLEAGAALWKRPCPVGASPYLVDDGAGGTFVGGSYRRVTRVDARGAETWPAPKSGHDGPVVQVAFAPEGSQSLASAGLRTLLRWKLDATGAAEVGRVDAGLILGSALGGTRRALAYSIPGGLARERAAGPMFIAWDLSSGNGVNFPRVDPGPMAVSADGGVGVYATRGGVKALVLLDLQRGAEVRRIPLAKSATRVALSRGGRWVAAHDGALGVWETSSGREVLRTQTSFYDRLAFLPGADEVPQGVACSDTFGEVEVRSLPEGRVQGGLTVGAELEAMLGLPGGRLVTAGEDGRVLLWDLARGAEPIAEFDLLDPLDLPLCLARSSQGRLAVGTGKSRILIYRWDE